MTIPPHVVPAASAVPARTLTGLCARGDHRFCQGRVYNGHDGSRSVYKPCDCTCHSEAQAA